MFHALRQTGRTAQPVRLLTTGLYGDTVDQLFNSLAFFYHRAGSRYAAAREQLQPILADLVQTDINQPQLRLDVTEVVFCVH